jgi:hypothetical protein
LSQHVDMPQPASSSFCHPIFTGRSVRITTAILEAHLLKLSAPQLLFNDLLAYTPLFGHAMM